MPEEKRSLKVFLCYSHQDHENVHKLHNRLKRDGVDVWFDEKKLLGGANWEYEIRKAVRENDVIIVCLSRQCNSSGFRQKEVEIALDEAALKPQDEIFVIPVRLEECEVPAQLQIRQWVDLFRRGGYLKLMESLHSRAAQLQRAAVKLPKPNEAGLGPVEELKPAQTQNIFVNVGGNVGGNITIGNENTVQASTIPPTPEKPAEIKHPVIDGEKEPEREVVEEKALTSPSYSGSQFKKVIDSQERVLEAAIEKEVCVGVPASLFVWIRRLESKNIISVVSSIDEEVLLDEDNVKTKGLEIEFPIENGQILPVGISLRLVAHEFSPSIQQKKINVPPEGDSGVCTFIAIPKKAGKLLLNLEVLKDEVSLATRTLRTTAIETEKKESSSLALVSIPITVLVQAAKVGGNVSGNIIIGNQNDASASTAQLTPEKPAEAKPPVMDEKKEPQEQLKPDETKNIIDGDNVPKESIIDGQNDVPATTGQLAPEKPVETESPVMAGKKEPEEKPRKLGAKYIGVIIGTVAVIIACLALTQLISSGYMATGTSTPTFTDMPTPANTPTPTDAPILADTPTPADTMISTPTEPPTIAPSATQYQYAMCSWSRKEEGKKGKSWLNDACLCTDTSCACSETEDWARTPSPAFGSSSLTYSRDQVNHLIVEFGGSCHQ
ncbi:MAG: toll/interleukin-1 receptor domain-containing protein [Anaerolineales bacterium]